MINIKLFATVLLIYTTLQAGPVQAVTISSECAEENFVYQAKFYGGGTDDIGATGSWSNVFSNGWFRIGPFKDYDFPAGFVGARITAKGVALTRWDSLDSNVIFACHHPTNGEKYDISFSGNKGRRSDPVKQCIDEGGQWAPFEKISQYGKYTVKNCDVPQLDPEVVRYHWTDGSMHFAPVQGKTWHMVTSRDERFTEVFRDRNAIIIQRSEFPKFFMMKNEAVYTKNQLSDASWSKLIDGGWRL